MNLSPPPNHATTDQLLRWCNDLFKFLQYPTFELIKITSRSTAPTGETGLFYFSNVDNIAKTYNGTSYIDIYNGQNEGLIHRPVFTYNGGATAYTIKVGGALYRCSDKLAYWDSELTTSAIGSPVASTWYYLYLDYSAITSGVALTNAALLWSSTAPTYSHSLRGWYNGSDRCIFAAITDGTPTDILEFFHSDNEIVFSNHISNKSLALITDTNWHDLTLTAPAFCNKVRVETQTLGQTGPSNVFWRTNGQTGSTGHSMTISDNGIYDINQINMITDTSQIIEYKAQTANYTQLAMHTNGWFLPAGM